MDKKQGRITLNYRFLPEDETFPMKLKLEINTAEHFSVYGFQHRQFTVNSRWFRRRSTNLYLLIGRIDGHQIAGFISKEKRKRLI